MAHAAYLIEGRCFEADAPGLADALAAAHASRHRPRCLCLVEGAEMYVARYGDVFVLKRMPGGGGRHAPDCPSYEPPAELSGLGQVLGSAITEDATTGITMLRLGFALSNTGATSVQPGANADLGSVKSAGSKLGLRGLLHFLWDRAELTRWHPGFEGKRSWGLVRRQLLSAAEGTIARGRALLDRLYIPEVFSVDQRDAINARRTSQWARAARPGGAIRPLALLIGELKEMAPCRFGHKAVIKHVPDQAFTMEGDLYRRVERCFAEALSLWGAADNLHLILMATFGVNDAGVPSLGEVTLMPTTAQWLPVEDAWDVRLIERLVREQRRFAKCLRYDLPGDQSMATATLLDTAPLPTALFIAGRGFGAACATTVIPVATSEWSHRTWDLRASDVPQLPKAEAREGSSRTVVNRGD